MTGRLNRQLSDLEFARSALERQKSSLESELAANQQEISGLKSTVAQMTSSLAGIEAELSATKVTAVHRAVQWQNLVNIGAPVGLSC